MPCRQSRLRAVGQVCANRPHVWLLPLVLMGLMLGLGIWAVKQGARSYVNTEMQKVNSSLGVAASNMQLTIQNAIMPIVQLADWVKHTVNVTTLNNQFFDRVPDWFGRAGVDWAMLSMLPAGVLTRYYPRTNAIMPPNLDLLMIPGRRELVLAGIVKGGLAVSAPDKSLATNAPANSLILSFSYQIVLSNVTTQQLWQGRPPYKCPPGLCYNNVTKTGWWGSAAYTMDMAYVLAKDGPLAQLYSDGYHVQTWRSPLMLLNETDWAVLNPDSNTTVPPLPEDALQATLEVTPYQYWRIYAWQDSWEPGWKLPLFAVVVVASVVCGLLVFMVLLSWEEHRVLLHSILPKSAIDRLRDQIDFSKAFAEKEMLNVVELETPAKHMLSIIKSNMDGEVASMSVLVAVQQALQRCQDVYRPASQDLQNRLRKAGDIDDEVQQALVNQLAGHRGSSLIEDCNTADSDWPLISTEADDGPGPKNDDDKKTPPKNRGTATSPSLLPATGRAQQVASREHLVVNIDDIDTVLVGLMGVKKPGGDGGLIPSEATLENPSCEGDVAIECEGATNPEKPFLSEVEQVLATADTWKFDAFALEAASNGRPLSVLGYWLMHTSGCIDYAGMDPARLARFLQRIETGYKPNPYHNARHAADVLQTYHVICYQGGLMPGYVDPLTLLGCYLAAIIHDYEHLGVSNDYLVTTQDQLAIRYNDKSPMENHHLAAAWQLLQQPEYNCLSGLTKTKWEKLRKLVIELVLGTDMRQHFAIMGQFTAQHSLQTVPVNQLLSGSGYNTPDRSTGARSTPGSGSERSPTLPRPAQPPPTPTNDQDKLLSLQVALKCADLGHLAAPLPVHLKWLAALEQEFFLQGDEERTRGLAISPLCDSAKEGVTKSQVGFMEFVVLPLFSNFCQQFKACQPLLRAAVSNYRYWKQKAEGGN